jgi:hypothetical protein
MFLSAGYAEGLLLLEVAAVLWLVHHRKWVLATMFAALAGATRPNGVLLALIVAVTCWTGLSGSVRRRVGLATALGILSLSGLLAHLSYLGIHYGRADAYVVAQSHWPRSDDDHAVLRAVTLEALWDSAYRPVREIKHGSEMLRPKTWAGPLVVAMLVVSMWALFQPMGLPRWWLLVPLGTFAMAYARDPVNGKIAESARYLTVSVPTFLWVGQRVVRSSTVRQWIAIGIAALLLAIQCLYVAGFARWEYAG